MGPTMGTILVMATTSEISPTNGSPSSDMTISVRTPITMLSMHLPSKKPLHMLLATSHRLNSFRT